MHCKLCARSVTYTHCDKCERCKRTSEKTEIMEEEEIRSQMIDSEVRLGKQKYQKRHIW